MHAVETIPVKEFNCKDLQSKWCKRMRSKKTEKFAKVCGKTGSETGFCCQTCKDLHAEENMTVPKTVETLTEQLETCQNENIFNNPGAFSDQPQSSMQSTDGSSSLISSKYLKVRLDSRVKGLDVTTNCPEWNRLGER